jgi:hypothetical protein
MQRDATAGKGMAGRLLAGLWRLAISPVTFVALSLLWCLDLGAGSLFAYWRADLFGTLDNYPFTVWLAQEGPRAWPASLWVHALVWLSWLMVASLLLCTGNWFLYRRKRLKGIGEVFVHLGFLLVFAGFVLGSAQGARVLGVKLPIGGSARVEALDATLTLRGLTPLIGPGGEVQGGVSDLELSSAGLKSASAKVMINHPLIAGTTVVYPRGVQQQLEGARLSLQGYGPIELRPGRPARLPGGLSLELAGMLQPEEIRGDAKGPGVFLVARSGTGNPIATLFLSDREDMPAEAFIAGQRIALAGFLGPPLAMFDIHRDPGVWLVLAGAVLITFGTLWAFGGYLREGIPS